jgi:hypothetical protein
VFLKPVRGFSCTGFGRETTYVSETLLVVTHIFENRFPHINDNFTCFREEVVATLTTHVGYKKHTTNFRMESKLNRSLEKQKNIWEEILQTPYLLSKCRESSQYTCEYNFSNALQSSTDFPAIIFTMLKILNRITCKFLILKFTHICSNVECWIKLIYASK